MEIAIEYGHEEEQTKKKSRAAGVETFMGFSWLVVGWRRGWEAVEVESKGGCV